MVGDKQEQKAESGSTAIQAHRDVHVHLGLSAAEVLKICTTFFEDNFPRLEEVARHTAEQNVRDFASELKERIIKETASIAVERFCEPDVQASINDAVMASARKGAAANPDLLSTLIVERVSKQRSDYKDIVICEAIKVVPKLTPPQIAFLSFVHFVESIKLTGLSEVSGLEPHGQKALVYSSPGFNLSGSQKQHIQYTGACSISRIGSGNVYEQLTRTYSEFGLANDVEFATAIRSQAPSFRAVVRQFQVENLYSCTLTSVGQAIAIANISNHIGKLDYSTWLK